MDDLRDLYQEVILDHGGIRGTSAPRIREPRGARTQRDVRRQIDVFLTVDENGRIEDAAFEGQGCAISVASASMMTEILRGRSEAEARALFKLVHATCTGTEAPEVADLDEDTADRIQILAGVRQYPMRVKCATLAWHTMEKAMDRGAEPVSTEVS